MKARLAKKYLKDSRRLSLKPGDILWVKFPDDTDPQGMAFAQEAIAKMLHGRGVKVVASYESVDVSVVRAP